MTGRRGATLWIVTEEDLAYHYDLAACPRCGGDTDEDCAEYENHKHGTRYWAIPEGARARLTVQAIKAIGASSVPNALYDVLSSVTAGA